MVLIAGRGALVAYPDRRDQYHECTKAPFGRIRPSQLTCEAVLAEACFRLRNVSGGSQRVRDLLERGVVFVAFRLDKELSGVAKLLARYANVPMSLADACLVRMAEQHPRGVVLTLDHDFHVYRKNGRQVIPTLMPDRR